MEDVQARHERLNELREKYNLHRQSRRQPAAVQQEDAGVKSSPTWSIAMPRPSALPSHPSSKSVECSGSSCTTLEPAPQPIHTQLWDHCETTQKAAEDTEIACRIEAATASTACTPDASPMRAFGAWSPEKTSRQHLLDHVLHRESRHAEVRSTLNELSSMLEHPRFEAAGPKVWTLSSNNVDKYEKESKELQQQLAERIKSIDSLQADLEFHKRLRSNLVDELHNEVSAARAHSESLEEILKAPAVTPVPQGHQSSSQRCSAGPLQKLATRANFFALNRELDRKIQEFRACQEAFATRRTCGQFLNIGLEGNVIEEAPYVAPPNLIEEPDMLARDVAVQPITPEPVDFTVGKIMATTNACGAGALAALALQSSSTGISRTSALAKQGLQRRYSASSRASTCTEKSAQTEWSIPQSFGQMLAAHPDSPRSGSLPLSVPSFVHAPSPRSLQSPREGNDVNKSCQTMWSIASHRGPPLHLSPPSSTRSDIRRTHSAPAIRGMRSLLLGEQARYAGSLHSAFDVPFSDAPASARRRSRSPNQARTFGSATAGIGVWSRSSPPVAGLQQHMNLPRSIVRGSRKRALSAPGRMSWTSPLASPRAFAWPVENTREVEAAVRTSRSFIGSYMDALRNAQRSPST